MVSKFTDEMVGRPLWEFKPYARPAVLHERRRRNMETDPEPIGDSEYA